jgi:hypothetical protein
MARNPRAAELAEAALNVRNVSAQTRAWSARQAALGHAYAGDAAACERRLHDAYGFLEHADSPVPPWAHEFRMTRSGTRATEACCWLAKAIGAKQTRSASAARELRQLRVVRSAA